MAQSYYTPRIIQIGQVPSTQTNFPALVLLNDARYKTIGNGGHVANANGYDIRFYSDSGLTTALTYQRIAYNASAGTGQFRVLVASAADALTIYIGYGDASLNTDGSSTAVWDSNNKGQWPFPDGTTLDVNDYSQGGNNGTNNGATATSAQVDGGVNFNGTSAYVTVANESNFDEVNTLTIDSWVYIASGSSGTFNTKTLAGAIAGGGWGFDYAGFTAGQLEFFVTDGVFYLFGGAALSVNAWHRVVAKWDSGLSGNARMVMEFDGVGKSLTFNSNGSPSGILANNSPVTFGAYGSALTGFYAGSVDEAGFSNVIRTPNWGLTRLNNESNEPSFWPDGTEVPVGGGGSIVPIIMNSFRQRRAA